MSRKKTVNGRIISLIFFYIFLFLVVALFFCVRQLFKEEETVKTVRGEVVQDLTLPIIAEDIPEEEEEPKKEIRKQYPISPNLLAPPINSSPNEINQLTGTDLDGNRYIKVDSFSSLQNDIFLFAGEKYYFEMLVEPKNATNQRFRYKIKYFHDLEKNLVSINEAEGSLLALKKGNCQIEISLEDVAQPIILNVKIEGDMNVPYGYYEEWNATEENVIELVAELKTFAKESCMTLDETLDKNSLDNYSIYRTTQGYQKFTKEKIVSDLKEYLKDLFINCDRVNVFYKKINKANGENYRVYIVYPNENFKKSEVTL